MGPMALEDASHGGDVDDDAVLVKLDAVVDEIVAPADDGGPNAFDGAEAENAIIDTAELKRTAKAVSSFEKK